MKTMLTIEKNILALIDQRYITMSNVNKKLATYVKENIKLLPFLSIVELSRNVGISEASVTRFVRLLTFSSYANFVESARNAVKMDMFPFGRLKKALTSMDKNLTDGSFFKTLIDSNIQSLSQLWNDNFEQNLYAAAKTIAGSRRVYIIGSRSSYSIASYIAILLHTLRDAVHLLPEGAFQHLYDIESNDCVIAIAFARYAKVTCDVASYFFNKQCRVIALTDSHTSPLALTPDHVLLTPNSSTFTLSEAMTVAICLVTAVAKLNPLGALERMDKIEQLGEAYNVYL